MIASKGQLLLSVLPALVCYGYLPLRGQCNIQNRLDAFTDVTCH